MRLKIWQIVMVSFVVVVLAVFATVTPARAQTVNAALDNPFNTDLTGVFEFEVGCTVTYGIEGGWSYAYIYLTIAGEQQWSEYIEWYDINTKYLAKKVVAKPYDRDITCEVSGNIGYDTAQGTIRAGCDNTERDVIAREYDQFGVTPKPFCGDIRNQSPNYQYAPHFNWGELNGYFTTGNPHYGYGWIKSSLTNGLEATRSNYGASIYLSSGYRCPHGNAAVRGVSNSLHMQGRSADMYNNSCKCWTQSQFDALRSAASTTGTVELLFWTSYSDRHLHAAW